MKTKNYLSICLLFIISMHANAQTPKWQWERTGGLNSISSAHGLATDAKGNVYEVGGFKNLMQLDGTKLSMLGTENIYVVKYDASGKVLWAKQNTAASRSDAASSVVADDSGNVYVLGSFSSAYLQLDTFFIQKNSFTATWYDMFLTKFDANGKVLWVKIVGGFFDDVGTSIDKDSKGNIYISGYTDNSSITFGSAQLTNVGGRAFYIAKYDNSGQVLWAKISKGNNKDEPYALKVDNNDNIYVTGIFRSDSIQFDNYALTNADIGKASADIFLVKYNSAGTVQWAKSGSGAKNFDYATGVAIDPNNNVFISGNFYSPVIKFDTATVNIMSLSNSNDIFLVKYDAAGNVLWAKNKGQVSQQAYSSAIASDAAGNILMTGLFVKAQMNIDTVGVKNYKLYDNNDIFLYLLNNDGNAQWGKSAGGANDDAAATIAVGINNSVYIAGTTISTVCYFEKDSVTNSLSAYNMFIAKLNYGKTTTSIDEPISDIQNSIYIYPNPSHNSFKINASSIIYKTEIYNLSGALVLQGLNTVDMDVSMLNSGMYFIRVYTGKEVSVLKFVKE